MLALVLGALGILGVGLWSGGAMATMPRFRDIVPELWVALVIGVVMIVAAIVVAGTTI